MKNCAQPLVCAVGVLVLGATTRAATPDAGNPYADTILGRNVFSLKTPPPPPKPEDLVKKEPPPKILLQGLTTILGRPQVLFKVQMAAKPGQPAKEESFVMTVGERQGEIEVLEIDKNAEVVKFNNHGTIEPLNMKDHVAKATAAAPQPAAMPQPGRPGLPGVPPPTASVNPSAPGGTAVTTYGGGSDKIPSRILRTPTAPASGVPVSYGAGQTPPATQTGRPLSPDEQILMLKALEEANKGNPNFPPMPPILDEGTSSSPPPAPPGLPQIPRRP